MLAPFLAGFALCISDGDADLPQHLLVDLADRCSQRPDGENLVNYIDAIINTAMNGGDPMTVQEPSASCTGSCSTCGGCH